ncbi:MAG: hypothetical protein ACMG6S_04490, partial [Byssovorax sp.]
PMADGRGPLELAASAGRGMSTEMTGRVALAPGVRLDLFARSMSSSREIRRVVVAATVTAVADDPLVAAHALLRDLTQVVLAEEEAAKRLTRIHELEDQQRQILLDKSVAPPPVVDAGGEAGPPTPGSRGPTR